MQLRHPNAMMCIAWSFPIQTHPKWEMPFGMNIAMPYAWLCDNQMCNYLGSGIPLW